MSYILDALRKSEQQRGHGNIPDVQTVHSAGLNYRSEKKALWPYILVAAVLLNFAAIVYFIYDKSYLSGNQHMDDSFRGMQRMPVSTDQKTPEAPVQQDIAVATTDAVRSRATKTIDDTEQSDKRPATLQAAAEPYTARSPAADANAQVKAQVKAQAGSQVKAGVTASQAVVTQADATQAVATEAAATENLTSDQVVSYYDLPESIRIQLPAIIISAHVYSSNPKQRSIVINNDFMEEGEYFIDDLILHEITPNGAIFNYHGTLFSYGAVSSWQ